MKRLKSESDPETPSLISHLRAHRRLLKPEIKNQFIFTERGIHGHKYYYINDAFRDQAYTFRHMCQLNNFSTLESEEQTLLQLNLRLSIIPLRRKTHFITSYEDSSYELHLYSPYVRNLGLVKWRFYELEIKDIKQNKSFIVSFQPIGNYNNSNGFKLIFMDSQYWGQFQLDDQLLKPGTLFLYTNLERPILLAVLLSMSYICARLDCANFYYPKPNDLKVF